MPMLPERVDSVIGADTHRDTNEVEIAYPTGAVITTGQFSNDSAGYAATLAWINQHAPGPRRVLSIEGSRSYGIGLARAATAAGLPVVEAEQPTGRSRRGKGKSDPLDAHRAVLYALQQDADKLPTPRSDGDREGLRILLCARDEMTTTSTGQINRLKALLRAGDDTDRRYARDTLTITRLSELAKRRQPRDATREQAIRHAEIRRLAMAVREATRALAANYKQLASIVEDLVPGLLDRCGVGPVSGAQAIVSFSHTGRCRSDAAYAKLAGTSPLEASSGKTKRHRLNRGGDRALNNAMYTIAKTRMRYDPDTMAYVQRRTAEGKSKKEILRCLKRYITRQLYRTLTAATALNPAASST